MAPLLMHPRPQENTQQVHSLSLLSLQQQEHQPFIGSLIFHSTENLQHCIGSSNGYLAFLDQNSDPFLLNPISQTLIRLPKTQTLPPIHLSPHLPHSKIEKLVLCGDTAIIMHSGIRHQTSVSFCRHDDREWTGLRTRIATCHDVVCHDATKTAFVLGPGPTVEAWDMSGPIPCMRTTIGGKGSFCPGALARARELFPPDLYTARWYLAVSETGQIFLAVRYVGEFVRPGDGVAVREEDTITDDESGPSVCPYKTAGFEVFKYDGEMWVEVESLGDCAMFLGGNESMMVSTSGKEDYVKGNAIYFTDDYWDRVDEDCSYGGHDMGVFNLEDWRIEPVLGSDQVPRIVPPPFWISV